jgi:hypothetical protein
MNTESIYLDLGVSPKVYRMGEAVLADLTERFAAIDRNIGVSPRIASQLDLNDTLI